MNKRACALLLAALLSTATFAAQPDNAYTGFVKRIVATSCTARQGDWVTLQRDIAADYRRAFGAAPPRITGIAVAVDTDNKVESTVSWSRDIRLAAKAGAP